MREGYWPRGVPTKYRPLIDFLGAHPARHLTLTLVQIENILAAPLAVTAQVNGENWTGTRFAHVRAWRALGWRARLDRRNQCVHFTRDTGE